MKRLYTPLGVLLLTVLLAGGAQAQSVKGKGASQLDNARAVLARETAAFIENKGQWDSRARYLARMPGLDLWVTDGGLTYDLFRLDEMGGNSTQGGKRVGHVVRMSFEGAGNEAAAKGVDRLSGAYNYLTGKDRKGWASNVSRYSGARIEHLYNGIDAALYFDGGLPRYDLILAPGADPSDIRISYDGATSLSVNGKGELVIGTSIGDVKQQGLFAYQLVNGEKKQIACSFVVGNDKQIGFKVGAYDRSKPLVIDPLIYSTYFGGQDGWDEPRAIATDLAGMVYITGFTLAPSFPALAGSYQTNYGGTINGVPPGGDAFVAKLDITQSPANQLVYATFIGSTDDEVATDIAVDLQGSAHITGVAANTFPTTNTVVSIANRGVFAAKLTPSGGGLVYSTFVADDAFDNDGGIMLDNLGQATVTGSTTSTSFPAFPNSFQPANAGGSDVFVARLNPTGTALIYATYLGGSDDDVATDLAGDVTTIHVTGYTRSTNFPLTRATAFDTTHNGDLDGFVVRLEPSVLTGTAQMTYGTYFGGENDDVANALAVDSFGYINIAGYTASGDFPTKNAAQSVFIGGNRLGSDAFIMKINPFTTVASQLMFSSYLGGVNDDVATDIALDTDRDAYITGWTESGGFPVSGNALRPTFGGSVDGFVSKFISTTGELIYSTFLNGNGDDEAYGITISANEEINVTGSTTSTNYMVTPNALQGAHSGTAGGADGFITRFSILQVTSPNGGELICAGSIRNITWTGGTSTNYDLYISSNGGTTYNVLSLNVVGNTFAWPIPTGFPAGTRYRIKVMSSNGPENDISDSNFTINTPPVITRQPNNVTQPLGGTAVFNAGATAIPAPTVQWEVNNGTGWTPIPGATGTTLTLNNVTSAQSGSQYRAVFTNSCTSTTTNAVTLTVSSVRLVSPNGDEEWCAGTVHPITWDSGSANGPYDLAVSRDGGATWQTIAVGVNGSTYNWSIPGTFSGNQFLVQVRLSNGQTGDISDRPFTINSAPRISRQPGNLTVNAGSAASFPVEGGGSPFPTIQWEVNGGSGWSAVQGATGTTFVIQNATVAQSGTRVRAIFTNVCGSDTSREATLTVLPTSSVDDPTTGLGALRLSVAPNPVTSSGELKLSVPQSGRVQIDMTDINGNVVARLADRVMSAGDHQIAFNTAGIPNGTYLVTLNTNGQRRTVKLTVTK